MAEEKEKEEEKGAGTVSRRDFLKDAGLVVGGAVVGAAAGAGITYAVVEKEVVKEVPVTKEVTKEVTAPTTGVLPPALEPEQTFLEEIWQLAAVDVKNGKIIRRRPWNSTEATGVKPFTCTIKGKTWAAPDKTPLTPYAMAYKKRVYSPNRILYPLKRVDWEPGGDPAKLNTKNPWRKQVQENIVGRGYEHHSQRDHTTVREIWTGSNIHHQFPSWREGNGAQRPRDQQSVPRLLLLYQVQAIPNRTLKLPGQLGRVGLGRKACLGL